MKKILSTVAALGLVAGVASAASALELTVTGKYYVEGYYLSKACGGGFVPYSGEEDTVAYSVTNTANGAVSTGTTAIVEPFDGMSGDSFYVQKFLMKPVLKVNDSITMFSEIRFADDNIWGSQADGDSANYSPRNANTDNGNIDADKIYMEYMSPIGKFRIGRTPAGAWGTPFVDNSSRADRIMYWPNFLAKPWGLLAFLQKNTENDANFAAATAVSDDQDSDYYEVNVTYDAQGLNGALGLAYTDDQTTATTDYTTWKFKGYVDWKIANYFVASEFEYNDGSKDYDAANTDDDDINNFAFMMNVGGKFNALTTGLLYFYASGDGDPNDNDVDQFASLSGTTKASYITGKDWEPLYILTGRSAGILNQDFYDAANYDVGLAGVHALGIWADYAVTDKLTLHGVLGYAWADETGHWDDIVIDGDDVAFSRTGATVTPTSVGDRDSSYGWELDLGAAYKLLDNLTYEVHFGYVDTGDFFDADPAATMTVTSAGRSASFGGDRTYLIETDADNIYMVSHHLTMTF